MRLCSRGFSSVAVLLVAHFKQLRKIPLQNKIREESSPYLGTHFYPTVKLNAQLLPELTRGQKEAKKTIRILLTHKVWRFRDDFEKLHSMQTIGFYSYRLSYS